MGFSLQYWDAYCSFRASIIQGLHIMHTRGTKAFPSTTFPLSRATVLLLLRPMYICSFIYLLSFEWFMVVPSYFLVFVSKITWLCMLLFIVDFRPRLLCLFRDIICNLTSDCFLILPLMFVPIVLSSQVFEFSYCWRLILF